MRRISVAVVLVALVSASASASSVEAVADPPPTGAAGYTWVRADCTYDPVNDRYVAVGRIRTDVNSVPDNSKTYYQKVNIRIDKAVVGGEWRRLEGRTYSWSEFTHEDLPTFSTSGVKSVVGPSIASGGVLRVKVNAKLRQKRPGPDKTVWSYIVATDSFGCDFGTPGN
jgi:hypothetical protein